MVILDIGSGNTLRNDLTVARKVVDSIAKVDRKRECILKAQLWSKGSEPQCAMLRWDVFDYLFAYGTRMGFRVTASVFDKPSLDYLLTFDIPFVKLANRPYLRHLARYVPRGIPIVASCSPDEIEKRIIDGERCCGLPKAMFDFHWMMCVSEYPANDDDYLDVPEYVRRAIGLSDHTTGFEVYRAWKKSHDQYVKADFYYERHFCLPGSTGPDAGPWALRPRDVRRLLEAR